MTRPSAEGPRRRRLRRLLVLGAIAALAVVAASSGSALEPSSTAPSSAAKPCQRGFVHALIAGQHRCLKAGQTCQKRLDRAYHRFKFHCHGRRLTRAKAPARPPASPGVLERFQLSGEVYGFAVGADSLWAEVAEVGLERVDRSTRAVTTRVPDSGSPAFDGAELWVAAQRRVSKLDPRTGAAVASVPVVGEYSVVHPAEGAIWVASGEEGSRETRFAAVDPATVQVVRSITTTSCVGESADFNVGFGSLWLACKDDGTVLRFDAASGTTLATIRTGAGAHTIAIGYGSVWVTNYRANTLSRIDPATSRVVATISGVGRSPGITAALGAIWAGSPGAIAKIDPATNTVAGRLPLAGADPQEIYHIVEADGSLWASVVNLKRIYRLDPGAVR